MTVAVAILAGGKASRAGGAPKGLFEVGGRRILDRLVDAAGAGLGVEPFLVTNAPEAATWRPGLRVVGDLLPGAGTLGGIHAAVRAAGGPVLCLAWDMPFLTGPLLARIAAGLGEADVAIPASEGRRGLEPLCAGYRPSVAEPIEAAVARGDLRAIAFHDAVREAVIPREEVTRFGDPAILFFNVNDAAELARANALAAAGRA